MGPLKTISEILPENVNFAGRGVNRLYYSRFDQYTTNPNGIEILDEDWDTLIILDACRFDQFEQECDLSGSLSAVESKGSNTVEFLKGNFGGKTIRDTVYQTANPQLYRNSEYVNADFFKIDNIWMDEGWDDEYGTVLPETVTERSIKTHEEYPKKRHIVHYIQPHYPFLTDTEFDKGELDNSEGDRPPFWHQLMLGDLSVDGNRIWELFMENLRTVVPHVERLIENIEGKVVVTADHGNMFGERARPVPTTEWGHPPGIYTSELVKVPWLETVVGSRRKIVAEEQQSQGDDAEDEEVKKRLERLGYK